MPSKLSAVLQVRLRNIDLDRGHRRVLRDIDWTIAPGQRWILLGPNGAGKTQLLKLVAGAVWPKPTGRELRRYRLEQENWLSPQGIQDEIAYLGPERQDQYERYGWDHRVERIVGTGLYRTDIPLDSLTISDGRRIAALLKKLGIAHLATRKFLTLSYGERRLTLLARALASRPKLLLLDELFNGLDELYRARVLGWLERTSRDGLPWVLATHRMEDIPKSATHALILRNGRIAYRGSLRKAPLKRPLQQTKSRTAKQSARRPADPPVLVELSHASVYLDGKPAVRDISLQLRAGECWVVHGPNGSGKSSLLRAIYGDHPVRGGIQRSGIAPGMPLELFKQQAGWVAPHLQTGHPHYLSVMEVVQSGRYASIGLNDAPTAADRAAARRSLAFFGLTRLFGRRLNELSYGQMRRALFARAWINRPRLLLLDEPFAGVDAPTRATLLGHIETLIGRGVAVIIATHHAGEWPRQATHELQLSAGHAVYCGPIRRSAAQ